MDYGIHHGIGIGTVCKIFVLTLTVGYLLVLWLSSYFAFIPIIDIDDLQLNIIEYG